jgi:cell fate regulator YaaT (PSP1 superfamily)
MGCSSCGSTPGGCKSNGGCSSGGCNRFNVHNWLSGMPTSDFGKPYHIVEVSFSNGSRKDKNHTFHLFEKGDFVTVEGVGGYDVGTISLTGELVKLQMNKRGIKEESEEVRKILRLSSPEEVQKMDEARVREPQMLMRSRAVARQLRLDMKITEVELQADTKKATFFYIAEERVDFRELIKIYAGDFKVKVEMKQIGIRQEAGKVGGIGSCGRELCCSTWLQDFKSVSTLAARYQNLSINQTKLSGQCGRLKCCLNFELDTYMDALRVFPDGAEKLEIANGIAFLHKKDIFKNLMWYGFAGSTKQYPVTLERVREIQAMNKQGNKAPELGAIELEPKIEVEETVDLVGAISLKTLDDKAKKDRYKGPGQGGNRNNQQGGGNRPNNQGPRPNNQGGNRGPKPNNAGGPDAPNAGPAGPKPQGQKPQGQKPQGPRPEGQAKPKPGNNNRKPNTKPEGGNKPDGGNSNPPA